MKTKMTKTLLVGALLTAAATGASAKIVSTASLTNVDIQVFKVDPASALAPSVSFSGVYGASVNSTAFADPPLALSVDTLYGSGNPFASLAVEASVASNAGSSAAIAGDYFTGTGAAHTVAFASGGGYGSSSSFANLGDQATTGRFTVAPNTEMVISGLGAVDLLSDRPGTDEYGTANVHLELWHEDLDEQRSVAELLGSAGTRPGDTFKMSADGFLSVTFVNTSSSFEFGHLFAYVSSYTYSNIDATAIPEPAAAAMFLLGLSVLAVMRRRH
ncbi:MAG: PEP-CTERM sorting domain-containing protein [Burkholderiaceae bacterium]